MRLWFSSYNNVDILFDLITHPDHDPDVNIPKIHL